MNTFMRRTGYWTGRSSGYSTANSKKGQFSLFEFSNNYFSALLFLHPPHSSARWHFLFIFFFHSSCSFLFLLPHRIRYCSCCNVKALKKQNKTMEVKIIRKPKSKLIANEASVLSHYYQKPRPTHWKVNPSWADGILHFAGWLTI